MSNNDESLFTFLYKEHSIALRLGLDDDIGGLVHLKPQLGDHIRHKAVVGFHEERHISYELPAVVVYYILKTHVEWRLLW